MASLTVNTSSVAIFELESGCCLLRPLHLAQQAARPRSLTKDVDGEATNESEAKAARFNPVAYSILVLAPPLGAAMSFLDSRSRAAQTRPLQWDLPRWTGPVLWVTSCFAPHLRHFANTSPQVTAGVPSHYRMPSEDCSTKT